MSVEPFPPTVFVMGTSSNTGKTTACLGIIAKLLSTHHFPVSEVGYLKPMGQHTVTVVDEHGVSLEADRDAVLVTHLMGCGFPDYRQIGPVAWKSGLTAACIDEACACDPLVPRDRLLTCIRSAYQQVAHGKRVMVVEGTGQPGVGSLAGLSNGDVVTALRNMGVPVYLVVVVRGDLEQAIDQAFPYLMALSHMGTRLDALVINRVAPGDLDEVRSRVCAYYKDLFPRLYGERCEGVGAPEILGVVPEIPDLALPTMRLIAQRLRQEADSGLEVLGSDDLAQGALVRRIRVLSLEQRFEHLLAVGDAVVVGVNANARIVSLLEVHKDLVREHGAGLSGLLLSCKSAGGLLPRVRARLEASPLPAMLVSHETAELARRLALMPVKIQPYDTLKRDLIGQAYRTYLKPLPIFGAPPPSPGLVQTLPVA